MMEGMKREGEKANRTKRAQPKWLGYIGSEKLGEGKLSPAPGLERLG